MAKGFVTRLKERLKPKTEPGVKPQALTPAVGLKAHLLAKARKKPVK